MHYVMAGNDTDARDGLSVSFNATKMHDGFHLLRMTMVDATGNFGMNRTTVYINNGPPAQVILNAPDNVTSNSIAISWSMSPDEDFEAYMIYVSAINGSLGEVRQNFTDWKVTSTILPDLQPNKDYFFDSCNSGSVRGYFLLPSEMCMDISYGSSYGL